MSFLIRNMTIQDREEISKLIYYSTNQYYESIGRDPIFPGDDLSASIFFDVYQKLDPNLGLVAVDEKTNVIIGSCFVHPRETHVSLGIMNVHHEHFGRGVARQLLQRIIDFGNSQNKPVRLVSSCLNLDSYSLYTRSGFVPFCTYQDMYIEVPETGLQHPAPDGVSIRDAKIDDIDSMAALEMNISGISRVNDYQYFIEDADWTVSITEDENGITGFLASCGAEHFNMLGPGVSKKEIDAAALIHREANRHTGRSPVFLAPVRCGELVKTLYSWGARNCEMHVGQSYGASQSPKGVTLPTFLPESG